MLEVNGWEVTIPSFTLDIQFLSIVRNYSHRVNVAIPFPIERATGLLLSVSTRHTKDDFR